MCKLAVDYIASISRFRFTYMYLIFAVVYRSYLFKNSRQHYKNKAHSPLVEFNDRKFKINNETLALKAMCYYA